MRTVWAVPNNKTREETKFGSMPSQKPLVLNNRVILTTSHPGDIVLVPFAGVGSECVSAKLLGRHFIGFETNPKYIEISEKRLAFAEENLRQASLVGVAS
jgi:DNA modification methylase